MTILVLGGTGLLGRAAVAALEEAGNTVRVMARGAATAREHFGRQTEVVPGDLADTSALGAAMSGCFGVHISVGGAVDQLSAEQVCALARETGIGRITYVSGATVCEENRWFPMVAQKLNAESAIRESGISCTIFCPTWPMEMLARFVRGGRPVQIGRQPRPIHWYAVDDFGRMVAAAYQSAGALGKRFYIQGPEGISMREALERYSATLYPGSKPVSVMPVWMAKTLAAVTRNAELRYGARLMGYFDKIGEMGDPGEANMILGAPTTHLDDWISLQKAVARKRASQSQDRAQGTDGPPNAEQSR